MSIPNWFRARKLKEKEDNNELLVKDVDPVNYDLFFEIDGDQKAIRYVFYNCYISSCKVKTLSLYIMSREDGLIKVNSGDTTNNKVYNNWYK